jgi:hypothetical protein
MMVLDEDRVTARATRRNIGFGTNTNIPPAHSGASTNGNSLPSQSEAKFCEEQMRFPVLSYTDHHNEVSDKDAMREDMYHRFHARVVRVKKVKARREKNVLKIKKQAVLIARKEQRAEDKWVAERKERAHKKKIEMGLLPPRNGFAAATSHKNSCAGGRAGRRGM